MSGTTERFAVVTGANKGIGFEIVKQLAFNGVTVVLTARDEKRGLKALEKLKEEKVISEKVIFHQLDVADPSSVASLADFVKTQFGKLDILVNNAGVGGVSAPANATELSAEDLRREVIQTYELAEQCFRINYYGAKATAEALIPFLQLSDSPRIVNVSSSAGKLERTQNEWAKKILSDAESLWRFLINANEGAESPVRLALLPNDGPSGLFFVRSEVTPF